MLASIAAVIATCGIGKWAPAPGTCGSLLACVLAYLTFNYLNDLSCLCLSALIFIIGMACSNIYITAYGREDPSEIIVDELLGQLIVLWCIQRLVFINHLAIYQHFIWYWLMPFLIFRLCDILKPWPISWLDQHIKGGLGVMLDDIAAAILAIIIQYSIYLCLSI